MTMYEMQLWITTRVKDKLPSSKFESISCDGKPYRYNTYLEAEKILDRYYPDVLPEHKRVMAVEVKND